jgi:very-short-patch-repair endonuclease
MPLERTVLTSAQAAARGFSREYVRSQVRNGHWQSLHYGIMATFSGPVPRDLSIKAMLLAAGPDAVISHHTAAELAGLVDTRSAKIHLTVPWGRRVEPMDGAIVHVSRRLERARHPSRLPAQTRVEATVFDLADLVDRVDGAFGYLVTACQRRLTTPERLASFLRYRGRTRWRIELTEALRDIEGGSRSVLELRYFRDVERAHRLPTGRRQEPHERIGGRIYDDVRYDEFGLVVELDGRAAHPAETLLRDLRRDNEATVRGDGVLHYGWSDVTERPCRVAEQVATVLAGRGWRGVPRRCRRPDCFMTPR